MCGICGMVRGHGQQNADTPAVERMNLGLLHRGPDGGGILAEGPCALGARRLSIIDVELGNQPMHAAGGRYAIVFNGEIYNAADLRTELQERGHAFETRCDTEVLLRACIEWGERAVDRLNGMFAFAFYDRDARRLTLARDRLGIKPLYFMERHGDLYFASELDALLRSNKVPGTLNPGALDAYFTYLYIPAPETVFAEVFQLSPGEQLIWSDGRASRRAYWTPEWKSESSWTLDSAAERYKDLLGETVKMQRISDVPLGAFLSGGMDSASVVATMAESQSRPIETFTIGFAEAEADERAYADSVAQRFGTRHTSEVVNPDVAALLPALIPHFGQPFADSSAIPTFLVSKLARRSVTVALSGDGGDELFAGYSWLHMARRVAAYRKAPEALRRALGVILHSGDASPRIEKLRRFNQDSFLAPMDAYRRRQSCFYPDERAALYGPALARALERATVDRFQAHRDSPPDMADADRMLRQDLRMYLPDDVLTKVDRMSMAVSLEVRVPLLDHRIVEFAGTLPFHLKFDGGISKRVPKRAFRGLLPEPVMRQRKRGFSIPVDRWFRGPLDGFFRETVMARGSLTQNWLNEAEIARLWKLHLSGRRNLGHRLWCLLAFELWLRYVAEYTDVGVE